MTRIKPAQSEYASEDLRIQQDRLSAAFETCQGYHKLDTKSRSVNEVVKALARMIHLEKYEPIANLHMRLQELMKGAENGK